MELKDKLKALRNSKGLTQAQLADAIFVSRSAVAKWENGLGLPSEESMQLLQDFYGVSLAEISTTEPEAVIVEKNRKLHRIGRALGIILLLAAMVYCLSLPYLIQTRSYGITASMAAGPFADNPYIDTGDYRIYYSYYEGNWEDGSHWYSLSTFKPVGKHFWGCTVSIDDYEYQIVLHNREMVGKLYSIKGRHGYYHLFMNVNTGGDDPGIPKEFLTLEQIRIGLKIYPVQNGFFFVTPDEVESFWIGDTFLRVE